MSFNLGGGLRVQVTPVSDGKTEFETSRDGKAISVVYLPADEAAELRASLEETAR